MKIKFLFFLFFIPLWVFSQNLSNRRYHSIPVSKDTVKFDSLSVVPGSVFLFTSEGKVLDSNDYKIDYVNALLTWKNKMKRDSLDTLALFYRTFSFSFAEESNRRSLKKINEQGQGLYNPFLFELEKGNAEIFKFDGLNKNGSISRGISFGNNQDVVVNSSLNLQLSGKLSDDIEVLAAISDENIPFQPEGNTQQIQEFDKVFIQFSKKENKLIVGDFEIKQPDGYFMQYYKRAQGISMNGTFKMSKKKDAGLMKIGSSAAISKGKFNRFPIAGVEGNQGPYKLRGANNENYIIVLSGSERVFIDGILLTRGENNDYVIDYNTAEITFTPNRLITKDSRIVIEFEYSDKNYARTMLAFNNEYTYKKLKFRLNVFSEQDAKNQPLLQDLSDEQKAKLAESGDSTHLAITENIHEVPFSPDQVLYKKEFIHTALDSFPIYVYSTNPDSARYRLGFTLLGENKGDYKQVISTANGKVFQWVGKNLGDHMPTTLLIPPRSQQLYTFGVDYDFNKNSKLTNEIALSNYNQNQFSDKHKADDQGFAYKIGWENLKSLSKKEEELWKLRTNVNYELVNEHFTPFERFRSAEFERDWNVTNNTKQEKEHLASALAEISNKDIGSLAYNVKTFNKGKEYFGWMNILNTSNFWREYRLSTNTSYLMARGLDVSSKYLRQQEEFSKKIMKVIAGLKESHEVNRFSRNLADTLEKNSFFFHEWQVYLTNLDTASNKFKIDYTQRADYLPKKTRFGLSTMAKTLSLKTELMKNMNSQFSSITTYRTLEIYDSPNPTLKGENTFLNRIEYTFRLLQGAVTSTTFYQIGTGQELKRDYVFQETLPGKGNYIYRNDDNNNGVKDRNEYAIAAFADEGKYVKINVPGIEYIKTYSNEFNEVLNLTPEAIIKGDSGWAKFVNRFSNMSSVQLSQKTLKDSSVSEYSFLNPFNQGINDNNLITTQAAYRTTLYFNRTKSKVGIDLTLLNAMNKTLLSDGFESRTNNEQAINTRYDITRFYSFNTLSKQGRKGNSSTLGDRNYSIFYYELEPRFIIQPSTTIRLIFYYNHLNKVNESSAIRESVLHQKTGTELKFNTLKAGSIQVKFNYNHIKYNALENTSIAYEMLEGLRPGVNLSWGLTLQRSLSNSTQLSLNYDGRKSEDVPVIHTGGIQLRAFF